MSTKLLTALTKFGRSRSPPPWPLRPLRPLRPQKSPRRPSPASSSTRPARDGRKLAKLTSRPTSKRAAVLAAAQAGKLPPPPDFSAPTHAHYRDAAKALVDMAKAGDIEGLKATVIKPYSSSPKALAKYRDLAVIALEARHGAADSEAA